MWGHVVVSTVRRSWGRTAVRPGKKFSLQSSAEWRRCTYCLRQTIPNRCSSRREGSVADGSTHGAWGDERWRRRAQSPTCASCFHYEHWSPKLVNDGWIKIADESETNELVIPLVDMWADVSRLRWTDIEVAVVLWQQVDVVEYETIKVGERTRLDETDVHQWRLVEHDRLLLIIYRTYMSCTAVNNKT